MPWSTALRTACVKADQKPLHVSASRRTPCGLDMDLQFLVESKRESGGLVGKSTKLEIGRIQTPALERRE